MCSIKVLSAVEEEEYWKKTEDYRSIEKTCPKRPTFMIRSRFVRCYHKQVGYCGWIAAWHCSRDVR